MASDFFGNLRAFRERVAGDAEGTKSAVLRLVYGGASAQRRGAVEVVPWREIQDCSWL